MYILIIYEISYIINLNLYILLLLYSLYIPFRLLLHIF
jgi:hypothetical protein